MRFGESEEARQAKERQAFNAKCDSDVDLVLRACLPTYWDTSPGGKESKMVIGCLHPVEMLFIKDPQFFSVACRGCEYELTKEMVAIRLEAHKKTA